MKWPCSLGDGSVGKVFVMQARSVGHPQYAQKKARPCSLHLNPSHGEIFRALQPTSLACLVTSRPERDPFSKMNGALGCPPLSTGMGTLGHTLKVALRKASTEWIHYAIQQLRWWYQQMTQVKATLPKLQCLQGTGAVGKKLLSPRLQKDWRHNVGTVGTELSFGRKFTADTPTSSPNTFGWELLSSCSRCSLVFCSLFLCLVLFSVLCFSRQGYSV